MNNIPHNQQSDSNTANAINCVSEIEKDKCRISYEEFSNVYQEFIDKNEPVTYEKIREALNNRGSNTTIKKFIDQYNRDEVARKNLYFQNGITEEMVNRLAKKLAEAALFGNLKSCKQLVEEERLTIQKERESLNAHICNLNDSIAKKDRLISELEEKINKLTEEIEKLRNEKANQFVKNQETKEMFKQLMGSVEDLKNKMEEKEKAET
jgi:septal ring factor EnvC (AmiA/AmiB activator)